MYFDDCRAVNSDWDMLDRLGMSRRISSLRPWQQIGSGSVSQPAILLYDERDYRGAAYRVWNWVTGNYVLKEGAVTFGQMVGTQMACINAAADVERVPVGLPPASGAQVAHSCSVTGRRTVLGVGRT